MTPAHTLLLPISYPTPLLSISIRGSTPLLFKPSKTGWIPRWRYTSRDISDCIFRSRDKAAFLSRIGSVPGTKRNDNPSFFFVASCCRSLLISFLLLSSACRFADANFALGQEVSWLTKNPMLRLHFEKQFQYYALHPDYLQPLRPLFIDVNISIFLWWYWKITPWCSLFCGSWPDGNALAQCPLPRLSQPSKIVYVRHSRLAGDQMAQNRIDKQTSNKQTRKERQALLVVHPPLNVYLSQREYFCESQRVPKQENIIERRREGIYRKCPWLSLSLSLSAICVWERQ